MSRNSGANLNSSVLFILAAVIYVSIFFLVMVEIFCSSVHVSYLVFISLNIIVLEGTSSFSEHGVAYKHIYKLNVNVPPHLCYPSQFWLMFKWYRGLFTLILTPLGRIWTDSLLEWSRKGTTICMSFIYFYIVLPMLLSPFISMWEWGN